MADSCRRTLEIEIPAEVVKAKVARIALDYQKHARLPGFRPGKAPLSLIHRRFEEDIRGQALQDLVPEYVETQVREQKLDPVGTPSITDVHFHADEPLRFKATLEVLPEITLGDYKSIRVTAEKTSVSDEEVEETLKRMQADGATFVAVDEARGLQDGDFASLAVIGSDPATAGAEDAKPAVTLDDVLCEIGSEDTVKEFNENLRGAKAGDERKFDVVYPEDFRDQRLAGKTLSYQVKVLGIKKKHLPELDDEFAKEMGPFENMAALRQRIKDDMAAHKQHEAEDQAHRKLRQELNEMHDFPLPESLVEKQTDRRMDRLRRQLSAQGMGEQLGGFDWSKVRTSQREEAEQEVKTSLILGRIADKENVEVSDADVEAEVDRLTSVAGAQAAAVRSRLTTPEAVERMKDRLRVDKALELLMKQGAGA